MNKLSALWQGASYQDHLLQSYRKFHLLLQSSFIAVGAFLTVAAISFGYELRSVFVYLLLVVFTVLALYMLFKTGKLIQTRAADVDYYHNQIIEAEKALPKEDQILTAFKVYQKFARGEANVNAFFLGFQLTDEIRDQLTEKGRGHTRSILDHHFHMGLCLCWAFLHLAVILDWIIPFVITLVDRP